MMTTMETRHEFVGIIGSRDYPRPQHVRDYVNQLSLDTVVVSGGADGVDIIAERTADLRQLPKFIIPPQYKRHGRVAPLTRNGHIVFYSHRVVAFWYRFSGGTADGIRHAIRTHKPLVVFDERFREIEYAVVVEHAFREH